jgi:hypothetical protein
MKRKMFITVVLILSVSFTARVFAQEVMEGQRGKSKSNLSNNKSAEESTVVCVGKIRCADGSCTIAFEQEIVSPPDASSGLPTGKRMHKPFVMTQELDKSSSSPVRESPTKGTMSSAVRESPTNLSGGKANFQDLSITVYVKGKSRSLPIVNGQFTMPADCPNGECDLVASWSWGESQSGTSSTGTKGSGISHYQATFNLTVDQGIYQASKYTKTGHVTLMK